MSSLKVPKKILMREYIESLIVAVVLALILRFFVISAYKIPTGSMVPTLKVGDFIFAYKLPYGVPVPFTDGARWGSQAPARGDVVVFRFPGNPKINYVKRVIGLPGDRIAIRTKKVYVNDVVAEYLPQKKEAIADLPGRDYYSVFEEKIGGSSHLVINNEADETEFFGPVVVPQGQIFVLGDNRDSSDDSRYWGTVPLNDLEGRVVLIWMSFDWADRWANDRFPSVRWSRVFQGVH